MKKIIAIVLVVYMFCCFTGCAKLADHQTEAFVTGSGFVVIEEFGRYGDTRTYLVYDPNTKVEYIVYHGTYHSTSICPYYDSDGNVVIYEGDAK